jgi:hypothetical protein
MKIGWLGLYEIAFILALGFMPFLWKIRRAIDPLGQIPQRFPSPSVIE